MRMHLMDAVMGVGTTHAHLLVVHNQHIVMDKPSNEAC